LGATIHWILMTPKTNIRVKFLTKHKERDVTHIWRRFFPRQNPTWDACQFIFDREERNYDWLVVYDDLPAVHGERHTLWEERLACPRQNTLLMTVEPANIKVYGTGFLEQFGWVLTSQEPWVINHPGVIRSQTGMVWFYPGNYDEIAAHVPEHKTANISTVCSSKQQKHTLHKRRYEFTQQLKRAIPELEIFGHGVRYVEKKNDALDPFRCHLTVENHFSMHHWTEKLADTFLGLCLPLYHGCPNVTDYFPAESTVPVNIHQFDESLARIQQVLRDREYEKRLSAIREARRLVIERYATFPQLARLITERHVPASTALVKTSDLIQSRRRWRWSHPFGAVGYGWERAFVALRFRRLRHN
jgi:hypothetical protein